VFDFLMKTTSAPCAFELCADVETQ
jgi:hypothetical protein